MTSTLVSGKTCQTIHSDISEPTIKSNIAYRLDQIAMERPDLAALIQGSRSGAEAISYRQLSERVSRKAGALRNSGLKTGDLVLMLEPMSIDLYVSILAVFRIGATVLILDAAAGKDKLEQAIARTNPRAVIAGGKGLLLALATTSVRNISLKFSDGFTPPGWHSLRRNHSDGTIPVEAIDAAHPALITLTSGSSGTPKMIVRSHEFLQKQLQAVSINCGVDPGSCELTSLPVFVLANLASCVTSVLPDAKLGNLQTMDVDPVVDQIRRYQPDRILASPLFIERIMAACKDRGIVLAHVKTVITGGGPVFPRLLNSARAVCPNADIVTVYGSTEAEPIAKIKFNDLTERDMDAIAGGAGLPVGFPVEQIKVRIMPLVEQDRELNHADRLSTLRHVCELAELPIDAVGEIIVTGEHVVKGYDQGIGDAETKLLIDGEIWHKTGDIGYLDRTGRLWLTGRRASLPNLNCMERSLDTSFAQCIEAVALCDDCIGRAACLTINDQTTLFLETVKGTAKVDTWPIKNRLNWGSVAAIKLVRKIPFDTRHSSKVLYHKLASSA